jgi:hypothetical protein
MDIQTIVDITTLIFVTIGVVALVDIIEITSNIKSTPEGEPNRMQKTLAEIKGKV